MPWRSMSRNSSAKRSSTAERDAAVAAHGGLAAQPLQIGLRAVSGRHVRLRQPISQVGGQVEGAALRDGQRVGDGFRQLLEQPRHPLRRLEVEVVVGPDVRERLVQRAVEVGGDERMLEPVALRCVVVDVVGRDDVHTGISRQGHQLAVARGVAFEEVALQLDVDAAGAERLAPVPQHS